MKIGIVIVATNAYFILGLRFIRRFMHYYEGDNIITFHFFSDTDPKDYLDANIKFYKTEHTNWVNGTNSKFSNILNLDTEDDYLFYFDADTNIDKSFKDWYLGDLVGGEHYGNRSVMKDKKPYDRNPKSKAYIPLDTQFEQIYYYGAFFGGTKDKMLDLCNILLINQLEDKKIDYEPAVNDESYINQYFHYNPPIMIPSNKFEFLISDKGGIGETRNTKLDISKFKQELLKNKNILFDIRNNQLCMI